MKKTFSVADFMKDGIKHAPELLEAPDPEVIRFEINMLRTQLLSATLQTGCDVLNRTLYLFGEVDDDMSYRFVTAIQALDREEGDIRVVMVSCGGSEPAGYAIYDAMRLCNNEITIDCYGAAQSIAALILQAGSLRRLSPECRFMIHNGTVDIAPGCDADTLVAIGKEVNNNNNRYHDILAERSGLSLAKVREYCQDEAYFSAIEAVKMGFADVVMKEKKKKKSKTKKKGKKK